VEASTRWQKDQQGLKFETQCGNHLVPMDAKSPIGRGEAPTPKQMLLAAITGCTGMDVIAHLKKVKQIPESFEITLSTEDSTTHPVVFQKLHLLYRLKSHGSKEAILDAVHRSMTQYCGVSAMISKACPITYDVWLEDEKIGQGTAAFSF